jgi:hypothetical protein
METRWFAARVSLLSIEYRDGGEKHHVDISPGPVDWEEPTGRVHRAVNVGEQPYEQVTVFLLDRPRCGAAANRGVARAMA